MNKFNMILMAGAAIVSAETYAGFGSFLKKTTTAVSTAAETVKSPSAAATSAASEAVPAAAVPGVAAIGSAALPWAMDPKGSDYEFREKVKEYVKTLGVAKNEDVVALDKQLRDRAAADRAIVKSGGAGKAKAEEELDRYETFLSALDDELMRMGFDGSVAQNGDVGFKSYQLRTKNASTRVMWDPQAQKYYFYELYSLDKMFLNEADVNEAKFTANQLYYASVFADKIDTNTGRKLRYGGRICASRILAALQNNSTGNVTKQPMPKKGKLHDEFAAEALVIARGTLSHPDAEEVVIDADDWQIDYKLGSPVRRRFGYWVIKKGDAGRKAFRMQACQDHQGGGNYGKLKYYAVGGGQMYVE